MGLGHGNTPTWLNQTDSGRTWASTNRAVQSGLVLNLDAGASTSYPGSGTAWTDLSGSNNNNGTLTNGPTYSTANGGSIVFDGTNDYVQLASQNLISVDFSVEMWFYATNASGNNVLYTSYNLPSGAQSQTFILELGGSKLYSSNGNGAGAFPSTTTVSNNTWYHVVVTYTASTTTQRLYVNGNLDVSGGGAITSGASSNFIGGSPGDNNIGSRWFGGRISAVRVYRTKALSTTEISQNYNALRGRFLV